MALSTCCPSCGTTFKVVTDQLKISKGWVRCGHCAQVFEATLYLRPGPKPAPASAPTLAVVDLPVDAKTIADKQLSKRPIDHIAEKDPVFAALASRGDLVAAAASPKPAPTPEPQVSFVRQAQRRAFWQGPRVRWALSLTALALLLILAWQVVLEQRNLLAAMEPQLTPWLNKLCRPVHCKVQPLQRIEAVVIDSSSFNKTAYGTYVLSFSLKNTSPVQLGMPWLELTLLDAQEKPLLRRVFTPAQLGATAVIPMLVAGGEFANTLTLKVAGGARVAGYRVLAFYP